MTKGNKGWMFFLVYTFFLIGSQISCQVQKNFLSLGLGIGMSSISGPAVAGALSFERNNNEVTFFGNAAHTFFRTRKYGYPEKRYWYNDKLVEYGLLYGRTYRKLKNLVLSVAIGPSKFQFEDRSIELYSGGGVSKFSSAGVKKKSTDDFGLSLHINCGFPGAEKLGSGLRIALNFNQHVTFLIFSFNFVIGLIPDKKKVSPSVTK